MPVKIATWNVNSVRIRAPMLTRFVAEHAPDVLCLQETKVEDTDFPRAMAEGLGFPHLHFHGEKSYNGVAILSKIPLTPLPAMDLLGNGSKRHIAAELAGGIRIHNFYVPAGGDIPDPDQNPKFEEKLRFVRGMTEWSQQEVKKSSRVVILGDFNIAPLEHDVWSSRQLRDVVSHTPIERELLTTLQGVSGGWVDAMRVLTPHDQKLYSWWSYRNRDWNASDRGRRLDHVWLSPALRQSLKHGLILRAARGFDTPSDHVPVMVELAA
jgi:exodeoxyribonuclease-3